MATMFICHSACSAVTLCSFEPPRDKTNEMTCAPSEDSGQPGHPPSLIAVRSMCS